MSETNNTKQVAWIAIGSLFSFGFSIVSSMILSRYFDKADYGTYKQVIYVYNTLLTVFTLGLPKAFSYFLPRVDIAQAKSVIKKITNLFFILGGSFSLLLYVSSSLIANILNNSELSVALKIFALVPFLMLPTMGLEGILATFKKTMFMAIYTIISRIFMLLCVAVPVLLFDATYKEALVGFVIASFISFVLALYFKFYPVRNEQNVASTLTYKEIFKFSLPLLFASGWGTIIASSDQFFISRYFGNEVFAEFSNGFIELPFVGMIIGACATVLSPVFSKLSYDTTNPKEDIYPIWISVFKKTAMLIYPLVLYCLFFADVVMVVLYGGQYENSSIYFRIKLFANFFTLIAYGPLIINIGKVKFYANVHMYSALVLVVLELVVVKLLPSAELVAGVSVLCHLGRIYCMMKLIANYLNLNFIQLFPTKLILKIIIPSILILTIDKLVVDNYLIYNYWGKFIISFSAYFILYIVYSLIAKLDYLNLIRPIIKKEIK